MIGLRAALDDLAELARGLSARVLTDHGLHAALRELAEGAPTTVTLSSITTVRYEPTIEATVVYVVAEALTNAIRHAQATQVEVGVADDDGRLQVCIADDGAGGATVRVGGGIEGLMDRVAALGGVLALHSAPNAGTTITASVPSA